MAVISFDFSSTASWPRTSRLLVANADTRCRAFCPRLHAGIDPAQVKAGANGAGIIRCELVQPFRLNCPQQIHAIIAAVWNRIVSAISPGPNDMAQPAALLSWECNIA